MSADIILLRPFLLAAFFFATVVRAETTSPQHPDTDGAHDMPKIIRWTQDGGVKVLLIERHDLPLVDIDVAFAAGSALDDANAPGVADMANGLLDTSSRDHDEDALHNALDNLAVSVESYSEEDRGGIRVRSLSDQKTLTRTLALANEILATPRYDPAILEREKQRVSTGLAQALTQPGFLAERTLTALNYPDHPYGYPARETTATIAAVTREQLVGFHNRHYVKNGAVVALVGDVDRKTAESTVRTLLAGLPDDAAPVPAASSVQVPSPSTGVTKKIPAPSAQVHILAGMPLITRNDPDYYALIAGNYILGGGGFDSRLMKQLRDRQGLTYGAYSSMNPLSDPGPFTVGLSTAKENADKALSSAREVITRFIAEGPSETELKQAKANIVGGFPLRLDTNAKQLAYLGIIGFYGLPDSFLSDYPAKINTLTTEDIRNAWQRRIDPDKLNAVVAGGS